MIQFYAQNLEGDCALGQEEAVHCMRVLRKKVGDIISVTDGRGRRYDCEILRGDAKRVDLRILSVKEESKSWPYRITLVVAPTKNGDRMSWLVEKAVEIGVDEIVFVETACSERKRVNIDRLRRNAISAMNQSLKCRMPEISGMISLKEAVKLPGERFFGYCSDEIPRLDFVKTYRKGADVVIMIGPEGDFTPKEVDFLMGEGFKPVTFGDERLRTETAALYGVVAVHVVNRE